MPLHNLSPDMLADIARTAAFRKPDEDPEGIYEVSFNHNTIIQNSMLHHIIYHQVSQIGSILAVADTDNDSFKQSSILIINAKLTLGYHQAIRLFIIRLFIIRFFTLR